MAQIQFDESEALITGIPDPIKKKWTEAHPDVDIQQELKLMECWLAANPQKRPKKNYQAFITRWLNRCQNGPRTAPQPHHNGIGPASTGKAHHDSLERCYRRMQKEYPNVFSEFVSWNFADDDPFQVSGEEIEETLGDWSLVSASFGIWTHQKLSVDGFVKWPWEMKQ